MNVPLTDTLAVRLAANSERRSSFHDITGPYSGDPGDIAMNSVRASVLWAPTPALRVLLKGRLQQPGFRRLSRRSGAGDQRSVQDHRQRPALGQGRDRPPVAERQLCLRQRNHPAFDHRLPGRDQRVLDRPGWGPAHANNTFYDRVEETVWSQKSTWSRRTTSA